MQTLLTKQAMDLAGEQLRDLKTKVDNWQAQNPAPHEPLPPLAQAQLLINKGWRAEPVAMFTGVPLDQVVPMLLHGEKLVELQQAHWQDGGQGISDQSLLAFAQANDIPFDTLKRAVRNGHAPGVALPPEMLPPPLPDVDNQRLR